MLYRRLGRSGIQLSAISLGAWATVGESLDLAATTRLLAEAFEAGVNFFDNAETYGDGESELLVGRALKTLAWPRESYLVSSKVYWGTGGRGPTARGLNRKHVIEACEASLRRLGVDHLDLYLCHRPDPETPLEETVRAMSDLVSHQGKVLYWGTSEWPAEAIFAADRFARDNGLVPPTTEQTQYNLCVRRRVEDEYPKVVASLGLGLMAWSPLAHGLLAGRYRDALPAKARLNRRGYEWLREEVLGAAEADRLRAGRELCEIADDHGVSPAQLSMAWVLRNPGVCTAITGASSSAQLRDTLGALRLVDSELLAATAGRLEEVFA